MRANTAENAKVEFEAGTDLMELQMLTDSGDHETFESGAEFWSERPGYEPEVMPNGLFSGGEVTPADTEDTVDVEALVAFLNGEKTSVASGTVSVTRPTTDVAKIDSITVDSSGTLVAVGGTEGSDQTFSSERDAAGGPPWIPTDSIEIAQVRMTTSATAILSSTQIKQILGQSLERYDYPVWDEILYGGKVKFAWELPAIHSDDAGSTVKAKQVFAQWGEPRFIEQPNSSDFNPPEESHSVSSTQVYNGTLAATSSSLGQGSFTTRLKDGVTDTLVKLRNQVLWFRHFPDRNKTPYTACQGKVGVETSNPANDFISAEVTISAKEEAGREAT